MCCCACVQILTVGEAAALGTAKISSQSNLMCLSIVEVPGCSNSSTERLHKFNPPNSTILETPKGVARVMIPVA